MEKQVHALIEESAVAIVNNDTATGLAKAKAAVRRATTIVRGKHELVFTDTGGRSGSKGAQLV